MAGYSNFKYKTMLYEESLWFKETIGRYVKSGSLVLNIGSSTRHFIEVEQPYIKQNIFDELAAKQCIIKNVDIKHAEGVDLVGDVTDKNFIESLKNLNPAIIICSNLLEHLESRKPFCEGLMQIMNKETLLFVSVPYSFPYHEDPIDTLYRPNLEELQQAFDKLILVEGKIVDCGFYFKQLSKDMDLIRSFLYFTKNLFRIVMATMLFDKTKFASMIWTVKRISASCAIFKSQ